MEAIHSRRAPGRMAACTDPRRRRVLDIADDKNSHGATGSKVWEASGVFASILQERAALREQPQNRQTILELGSGTGYLAMLLAAADRGTRVIATDMPERMRSLGFNLSRNELRHAVRCVPWDWSDAESPALDWAGITSCIAAEVVYYDESGGQQASLARTLATVVARCRPGLEVWLMLRVRVPPSNAATHGVTMRPSDSYDARSAVFSFIERALPTVGLRGELLPMGDEHASFLGGRLYQIRKLPTFECLRTAPMLEPPAVQRALAERLRSDWSWQRAIASGGDSPGGEAAAVAASSASAPHERHEAPAPATSSFSSPASSSASWRCEFEVMPAQDAVDLPPQRLMERLRATAAEGGCTQQGHEQGGVEQGGVRWVGWRRAGGFFGVHRLVLIGRVVDGVAASSSSSSDSSSDSSSVDGVLERLGACPLVQSARLLSVARADGPLDGPDEFAICAAIATPGVDVRSLRSRLRSGLSVAHVASLLAHGYVVCDGFLDAAAVGAVEHLARQSLEAHTAAHEDGIAWRQPEPRRARSDVSTWVTAGARPATDAAFADGVLPRLALLESDLRLFLRLRGVRELQLASYAAGGLGYRPHTDALPEADLAGCQRKVTAIVYLNSGWQEADGGKVRLWQADHDGGAQVDVAPLGGRLLLFLSGAVTHQVLPMHGASRLAATAWYH